MQSAVASFPVECAGKGRTSKGLRRSSIRYMTALLRSHFCRCAWPQRWKLHVLMNPFFVIVKVYHCGSLMWKTLQHQTSPSLSFLSSVRASASRGTGRRTGGSEPFLSTARGRLTRYVYQLPFRVSPLPSSHLSPLTSPRLSSLSCHVPFSPPPPSHHVTPL